MDYFAYTQNGYKEIVAPAKRLGIAKSPNLGDWFVGWSPRNDSDCAEGLGKIGFF